MYSPFCTAVQLLHKSANCTANLVNRTQNEIYDSNNSEIASVVHKQLIILKIFWDDIYEHFYDMKRDICCLNQIYQRVETTNIVFTIDY